MSKRERSELARKELRRTFQLFSSMFPASSSLQSENNSEIEADFKMHLPYPLLDRYNCPVSLRSCNTYREHLLKTEALELKLPPCTANSAQIVMYHDKAFYCGSSCEHVPTSTITSLHQRPMRHGVQVATSGSGQLTQGQEDAAIQWYNSAQEAEEDDHDEDDNEDDNEDDEEPSYEDDDDEDYEDNDEEDDEDYD